MINTSAPVLAKGNVEIAASREIVWEILTTIDRWPKWNPDIKSVSVNGKLAAGSSFRWKAGPGTITSEIQLIEPPRLLIWKGKTLGIKAIHMWQLESQNNHTLVRSEESWEGFPPVSSAH